MPPWSRRSLDCSPTPHTPSPPAATPAAPASASARAQPPPSDHSIVKHSPPEPADLLPRPRRSTAGRWRRRWPKQSGDGVSGRQTVHSGMSPCSSSNNRLWRRRQSTSMWPRVTSSSERAAEGEVCCSRCSACCTTPQNRSSLLGDVVDDTERTSGRRPRGGGIRENPGNQTRRRLRGGGSRHFVVEQETIGEVLSKGEYGEVNRFIGEAQLEVRAQVQIPRPFRPWLEQTA